MEAIRFQCCRKSRGKIFPEVRQADPFEFLRREGEIERCNQSELGVGGHLTMYDAINIYSHFDMFHVFSELWTPTLR